MSSDLYTKHRNQYKNTEILQYYIPWIGKQINNVSAVMVRCHNPGGFYALCFSLALIIFIFISFSFPSFSQSKKCGMSVSGNAFIDMMEAKIKYFNKVKPWAV